MTDPKRPDCWAFAMDFLGGPEDAEVERYVSALEAEIERLRADAARYRWLRDNDIGDYALCVWDDVDASYCREDAAAADSAIDAAMKDAP